MPSTELLLRIKVSKGYVVRINDKFLQYEVISLMAQWLHHHIEVLV